MLYYSTVAQMAPEGTPHIMRGNMVLVEIRSKGKITKTTINPYSNKGYVPATAPALVRETVTTADFAAMFNKFEEKSHKVLGEKPQRQFHKTRPPHWK